MFSSSNAETEKPLMLLEEVNTASLIQIESSGSSTRQGGFRAHVPFFLYFLPVPVFCGLWVCYILFILSYGLTVYPYTWEDYLDQRLRIYLCARMELPGT
jgi:hypothetical protein